MWLSLAASTVALYTVSTTCAAVNLVSRVDVNAVMLNQNLISALTGRYSGLCSGRINVVVRAALTVLTSFFFSSARNCIMSAIVQGTVCQHAPFNIFFGQLRNQHCRGILFYRLPQVLRPACRHSDCRIS